MHFFLSAEQMETTVLQTQFERQNNPVNHFPCSKRTTIPIRDCINDCKCVPIPCATRKKESFIEKPLTIQFDRRFLQSSNTSSQWRFQQASITNRVETVSQIDGGKSLKLFWKTEFASLSFHHKHNLIHMSTMVMNVEAILYWTTKRVHMRFVLEHLITVLFTFPGFIIVSVTVVFHRVCIYRQNGRSRSKIPGIVHGLFLRSLVCCTCIVEMQPSHKVHHQTASELPLVR